MVKFWIADKREWETQNNLPFPKNQPIERGNKNQKLHYIELFMNQLQPGDKVDSNSPLLTYLTEVDRLLVVMKAIAITYFSCRQKQFLHRLFSVLLVLLLQRLLAF